MPEMNGYDASSVMKGDEELRDIPVVALTSSGMQLQEEEIPSCATAICASW